MKTTTVPAASVLVLAVAIYVRASKDPDKTRSSTKRQIALGRRRLAEKGLPEPVIIFEDDDVSAAKRGVVRDDFLNMIAAMSSGQFNVVWIWEKERLNRRLSDFEHVTEVAVEHGIRFLVDDKWFDPSDDDEWALAGIGAVLGGREVRKLRRRAMDGIDAHAKAGRPYGPPGFGYRATYRMGPGGVQDRKSRVDVVHDREKEILVELAEKVIQGVPRNALCRDLEARGVLTSRGNWRWSEGALKALLLRPKLVGDRDRKGVVVAKGLWEPIFDRETHNNLQKAFAKPTKHGRPGKGGGRGRPPSRLLSGIALCGGCEAVMHCDKNRPDAAALYVCSNRGRGSDDHVGRSVTIPEEVVTDYVLAFLLSDEAQEIIEASRSDTGRKIAEEIDDIDTRLKVAATMFAKKQINEASLAAINEELLPQREQLERQLDLEPDVPVWADLAGPRAAKLWQAIDVQRQRAVVAELFVVRILPVGRGRKSGREHTEVIPRVRLALAA